MYGADVSLMLISKVTNTVKKQVAEWQNRPLDALYPIVYLDCIVVKVCHSGSVINKAVFLSLGINTEGQKELLGMWLAENEGAKFWLSVLTELKNRGLQDILIACVDGLKGFPDAINSVYPQVHIQLCIIHMVRNSLKYVSWKDYKAITGALKTVYQAPTEEAALMALDTFASAKDDKYPQISKNWRAHGENLNTFFGYPTDIRKAIYTTHECHRVAEQRYPCSHQKVKGIPDRRLGAKSYLSGDQGCFKEMEYTDPELAAGNEPFYYRVW